MTDSGYASQSQRSSSPHLDVDGLSHWKEKPITKDLWNRFEDVRARLQMPLVTYLKKKKKPINVTFKLSALGSDLESAVFWIVILCPEKSSKKTKKFVEERKARRFVRGDSPGQVTLGIKVVSSPLIPTATSDTIRVSGALCDELGCASIKFQHDDETYYGTLGGWIRIVDADNNDHIYGLTANHVFQSLTNTDDGITSESDSDSGSESNTSDSDFNYPDGTKSEDLATQTSLDQKAKDENGDSKRIASKDMIDAVRVLTCASQDALVHPNIHDDRPTTIPNIPNDSTAHITTAGITNVRVSLMM
jgi:hypothetical protein